ncbi:MAG: cobalamin-dependent protein [Spirochaetales bacterium]|jgi:radical SAM superfamily enzyme YgiQ (UPF0313 family)|nr:cobalamin-dependent protein [Spirochaetales bacterium]
MKILLINPPNSGRSIPEEEYGIDTLKPIFRGEPLALEVLAGNLQGYEVMILDLKVEPNGLAESLAAFSPDLVGITGMTCEANGMLAIAEQVKTYNQSIHIVVGGIYASMDGEFFNVPAVDYIVQGIGKLSFRMLVDCIEREERIIDLPAVARTSPGTALIFPKKNYSATDLVEERPPRYDLVDKYRPSYTLTSLNLDMGFVATAFGCPFRCNFCCIRSLTDGKYLHHSVDSVLRDIKLLGDIPVIRLLDANTFGSISQATQLCTAIKDAGINKQFLADVRSDTVVKHPELMAQWHAAGLRAVIIGFEEITDQGLKEMNKANNVAVNSRAIEILHDIGITIVGDFIISPWYNESDFDSLQRYINDHTIDLPMITVLTPLPGTPLYQEYQSKITITDLDYYTLTNAVMETKLDTALFYQRYATLLAEGHRGAKL